MNHDQPDWLVATAAKFGYGRVTIGDGYTLKFEYIRTAVSASPCKLPASSCSKISEKGLCQRRGSCMTVGRSWGV